MKTDPSTEVISAVGELIYTLPTLFDGWRVTAIEGGTVTRAGVALAVGTVLGAANVLTLTPAAQDGTTTLTVRLDNQEFSGEYGELEGRPDLSGLDGLAAFDTRLTELIGRVETLETQGGSAGSPPAGTRYGETRTGYRSTLSGSRWIEHRIRVLSPFSLGAYALWVGGRASPGTLRLQVWRSDATWTPGAALADVVLPQNLAEEEWADALFDLPDVALAVGDHVLLRASSGDGGMVYLDGEYVDSGAGNEVEAGAVMSAWTGSSNADAIRYTAHLIVGGETGEEDAISDLAQLSPGHEALYTGVTPPRRVYRAPDGTLYYGPAYSAAP